MKPISFLGLILFVGGFVSGLSVSAGAKEIPIKVILDNGTRTVEKKIYDIKNEYYIDVAEVAGLITADLKWLPVSRKVILTYRGNKVEFFFQSTKIVLNGQLLKMNIASRVEKGDLLIPFCFVTSGAFSGVLQKKIIWNSKTKTLRFQDFPNILDLQVKREGNSCQLSLETKNKLYCEPKKIDANRLEVEIYKGVLDPYHIPALTQDALITRMNFRQESNRVVWQLEVCPEFEYLVTTADNPCRIVVNVHPVRKSLQDEVEKPGQESPDFSNGVKKVGETLYPPEVIITASSALVAHMPPRIPEVTTPPLPILIPLPQVAETPKPVGATLTNHKKIYTIVIDAGHGGKDPGAIGSQGTKEKDINLDIAFDLAQIFHKKTDMKVILTRKDDEFIPLGERTQIANDKKADIFVSIHCNSGLEREAKGFEIYFLSDRASDQAAEAVANIENSVIDLEDNTEVNDKLKSILWSLTLNEFMNDSSELCSLVVNRVNDGDFDLVNRGVKQAGFFVLRGAKMPAILVECAFLSNRREEKLLNRKRFREKLAQCLFRGIIDYINRKEQS